MTDKKIDDGGPAFPDPTFELSSSMSLRAYFAGLAMQGILSGPRGFPSSALDPIWVSKEALENADCLIAALKEPQK